MSTVWLHDWSVGNKWSKNHEIDALIADFNIGKQDIEGYEILLASYTYEDYSGDAFVLFNHDGKMYEVNGSHCSCYGLEEQWIPEEVTEADLWHRL